MKKIILAVAVIALIVGFTLTRNNNKVTIEEEVETTVSKETAETDDVSKEKLKLVVGMSGGYKPYTYLDENTELTGFDVDVWKEIASRLGATVEFETADFSGLFGLLDSGKLTTIANQITVTDERKEKYDFTDAYVYYGAQLIVKSDNDDIKTLEDLKGKKVGVSLGSNYEQMVKDFDVDNEIDVITYESYQGSLQDVSIGRIDAVLNDKLAGLIAIEESGLSIKFGGDAVEKLKNAFPLLKTEDNKELIILVNGALNEMREDGKLSEISLKYFPVDITKE
ncbi:MAG: amino acid ABC transporter substrate-binding protein [Acidaminobacteraceae bacterium]